MADLGKIELSVSAEISGLISGLDKAETLITGFGKVAQSAGSSVAPATRQIENMGKGLVDLSKDAATAAVGIEKIAPPASKVQVELAKTAVAAAKLDSTLASSKTGSNQAANALQNVGRVAQDLPFGFIGIQNNLNPLLESFQRLRAETGSTGGALKALASSLTGAGGLGLALSVVSSAILIYQQHFAGATKTTTESAKAVELIASTYDKFLQELEKTSEVAGKEAAKVSILFDALSDSNIGLRERKGIIEQLNAISPGYLGSLDKEKASYDAIAKSVLAYTESLAQSTEIKALLPQVDSLFKGLINAQIQLNQLRRFQGKPGEDAGLLGLSDADFKAEESRILGSIKNFQNQIKIAKTGLTSFAGGALNLSEILFGKTPELSKSTKETETINDVLEKLGRQINLLNQKKLDLGIDQSKEKISAITSAISTLVEKFKVDPKGTIIQKLFGDIKDINIELFRSDLQKTIANIHLKTSAEILFDIEQAQKELDAQTGKKKLKTKAEIQFSIAHSDAGAPKGFTPSTTQYADAIEDHQKFLNQIEQANQNAADTLRTSFDSMIGSIGESIGDSLASGANFGATVFGNLFKLLGAGLKQLGQAMIALGTAKTVLEKFKFAPGIGTVVAGIATVAIGALIERVVPGFAVGTQNFRGGTALVGERGPELVTLPKGAGVIPNDKLAGIGGGQSIQVFGEFVQRGQDLVAVVTQTNKSNGRRF